MNGYVTCERASAERIEKKSRFLGFAAPVRGEEEALRELAAIRKAHFGADHVCYAYVADPEGRCVRCCDDSEPSGTAGTPVLQAIAARGLRCVLVAVVRYFGGVKLGTGGLTRAYGGAAAQVLEAAGRKQIIPCAVYRLTLDYQTAKQTEKNLRKLLCKSPAAEYNKDVTYLCHVPIGLDFAAEVRALTSGKYEPRFLGEEYAETDRPVPSD